MAAVVKMSTYSAPGAVVGLMMSYRVSGPISTAITVVSAYNGHAFNAVAY